MRRFTDEELNLAIKALQTEELLEGFKELSKAQWLFQAIRLVNGYVVLFRAFPNIHINVLVYQDVIKGDTTKIFFMTSAFAEDIQWLEEKIRSTFLTS
ncbi:MAG: hypothetical protein COU22_02705 [Candidatus Komeilibacteria bacterium CG10_big_fil_rev_8_21_14_0_10_41_13]|uniref:Uncharacterized protein n=1 Tax=Candidatus Komeilibacteria bacterium CG10_big_fil_rev_8_21_14_0_10_41_13 TaxID=1974476 RepID=A0A2M6WC23_9BACT|nr:MAG: hypothetical protein COU22_02705 [Candidatus Komeilibacteria bacterium CG10_big_fil_rev_8_21_14_0_10_41_13]